MREDWFRSRKTAGFSVSSAGWRFGDGDVYEVIKVGRRTAKRERERESLLSRKATREEGVNGNGLKTPTIQRKLKLSNVGGDYSQGNVRFHELQKLSLDPSWCAYHTVPTRSTRSSFLRGNKNKSLPRPLVKARV